MAISRFLDTDTSCNLVIHQCCLCILDIIQNHGIYIKILSYDTQLPKQLILSTNAFPKVFRLPQKTIQVESKIKIFGQKQGKQDLFLPLFVQYFTLIRHFHICLPVYNVLRSVSLNLIQLLNLAQSCIIICDISWMISLNNQEGNYFDF